LTKQRKSDIDDEHLRRVRRICAAMPETTEQLSHGEPTFFVRKKVFGMFANNHHDGHIAVWDTCAARPPTDANRLLARGILQTSLRWRAWRVGIELDGISDDDLAFHIREARRLGARKRLKTK
jgi:hypothetical protein